MGKAVCPLPGIGHLDILKQPDGPPHSLLLVHPVQHNRLADLISHRIHRVQRIQRILEDHADLLSPDGLHLFFRTGHQVPPVKPDLPLYLCVSPGEQPHDAVGHRGFSAAGFPDHREDLPLADVHADVIDRGQVSALDLVINAEMLQA